ncbi:MAG: hypothetical protein H0Z22_05890 [Thermosipho sp. (in: Bacteria)]|nr:hypothetical protein [Thermosipho sp. (in: thermotogales)]
MKKIGVQVHILKHLKLEISPLKDLKSIVELKRLIKNKKYDVVHLHSVKASFIDRISAKLACVKSYIYCSRMVVY